MKIEALDHVALWVADRDELANFACEHLGMHVIDRTDASRSLARMPGAAS